MCAVWRRHTTDRRFLVTAENDIMNWQIDPQRATARRQTVNPFLPLALATFSWQLLLVFQTKLTRTTFGLVSKGLVCVNYIRLGVFEWGAHRSAVSVVPPRMSGLTAYSVNLMIKHEFDVYMSFINITAQIQSICVWCLCGCITFHVTKCCAYVQDFPLYCKR